MKFRAQIPVSTFYKATKTIDGYALGYVERDVEVEDEYFMEESYDALRMKIEGRNFGFRHHKGMFYSNIQDLKVLASERRYFLERIFKVDYEHLLDIDKAICSKSDIVKYSLIPDNGDDRRLLYTGFHKKIWTDISRIHLLSDLNPYPLYRGHVWKEYIKETNGEQILDFLKDMLCRNRLVTMDLQPLEPKRILDRTPLDEAVEDSYSNVLRNASILKHGGNNLFWQTEEPVLYAYLRGGEKRKNIVITPHKHKEFVLSLTDWSRKEEILKNHFGDYNITSAIEDIDFLDTSCFQKDSLVETVKSNISAISTSISSWIEYKSAMTANDIIETVSADELRIIQTLKTMFKSNAFENDEIQAIDYILAQRNNSDSVIHKALRQYEYYFDQLELIYNSYRSSDIKIENLRDFT